jgi:hypothetical protein
MINATADLPPKSDDVVEVPRELLQATVKIMSESMVYGTYSDDVGVSMKAFDKTMDARDIEMELRAILSDPAKGVG